jgi:TolB-like protein/class 3 adenylate cyclase
MSTDLVIILSSDWVGSTATRADLGEEPADALQEAHDVVVRRIVEAADGRVVKHSGDGVLAIFHSATSALGASLRMHADFAAMTDLPVPIRLRVGLAAGEIKHQSGDVFGLPVIEAVRLQSIARTGETLCSDLVRVLTYGRGGFEFETTGSHALKGLPKPVEALRVKRAMQGIAVNAAPATAATSAPINRARYGRYAAAALVVLAAAGFFTWRGSEPAIPASTSAATESGLRESGGTVATAAAESIAVLPFANSSPDPGQDYFADGISGALLDALSGVTGLQVTGRVSSFRYKGTTESSRAIGDALGVEHLLAGSVQRSGDRMRVTAELTNAASGYQLWSEVYERPVGDIFEVQDEIAEKVATALQVTLGLVRNSEPGMTRNVAAYEEFMQAYARLSEYGPTTLPVAIEHAQRAVAIDPSFALGWLALREAYILGITADPGRAAEWGNRAAEALERARNLAPDSPSVRIALAGASASRGDWLEAAELLDSLGKPPPDAEGALQVGVGNVSAAVEAFERTRAADPLSPLVSLYLAEVYDVSGDYRAALDEFDRAAAIGELDLIIRGNVIMPVLAARDRPELERRLSVLTATELGEGLHLAMGKFLDDPAAAPAEIRRLAALPSSQGFIGSLVLASWAAYYGDAALSLELLDPIAPGQTNTLLWRPIFRDVRKLPGFKSIVERMGLVAYWRERGWGDFCQPTTGDDFECR